MLSVPLLATLRIILIIVLRIVISLGVVPFLIVILAVRNCIIIVHVPHRMLAP